MKKLSDADKILVLLYVAERGMPPWANGDVCVIASRLFDWPKDRASAAIKDCVRKGYADKTNGL